MRSVNERLRATLLRTGVTVEDLASCCGIDPKSVERWISADRLPHRRHRWAAARRLGVDETYLWPAALAGRAEAARSELLEVFPSRAAVPRETWLQLLDGAGDHIDVLVFSGTFYAQTQPRIAAQLTVRAAAGAKVRLCFGDPKSEAVAIRGREEGIGDTLGHKIRSSLTYYRPLLDVEGCEVRLHATTLYTSVFRYDDELLANPHAYGEAGSANPVLHLRRLDGAGLFDHYSHSFEHVWATALPWTGEI
jgi:transcriptional regulator with XRE-family HTH domain